VVSNVVDSSLDYDTRILLMLLHDPWLHVLQDQAQEIPLEWSSPIFDPHSHSTPLLAPDCADRSPERRASNWCRAEVTQQAEADASAPETLQHAAQATDGRQTRAPPRESIVFLTETVKTVTIFATLDYTRCHSCPLLDLTSNLLHSRQRHVRRGCAQPSAIHYCIVTYRPYSACDRIPRIFC
jgi:hypothetical protein